MMNTFQVWESLIIRLSVDHGILFETRVVTESSLPTDIFLLFFLNTFDQSWLWTMARYSK